MPFKHNASQRHRIPKARYRVANWPAYEAGLCRRGEVAFWLDEAAIVGWQAPRRTTPGGQPLYSDLAIELVLTLRLVFHLALRQAEGSHAVCCACSGLDWPYRITRPSPAVVAALPVVSALPPSIEAPFTSCSIAPTCSCSARASGMPKSTAARSGSGASSTSRWTPAPARSLRMC